MIHLEDEWRKQLLLSYFVGKERDGLKTPECVNRICLF